MVFCRLIIPLVSIFKLPMAVLQLLSDIYYINVVRKCDINYKYIVYW